MSLDTEKSRFFTKGRISILPRSGLLEIEMTWLPGIASIYDAVDIDRFLTFYIELLIICHNRFGKFLNSNVFEEMRHLW